MFHVFSQETTNWFNGLVSSNYALSGALILVFYCLIAFLVSASCKEYDSAGAFTLWERWRYEKSEGVVRLSTARVYVLRAMLVPISIVLLVTLVSIVGAKATYCDSLGEAWCWENGGLTGVHDHLDFLGYLIVALQGYVVSALVLVLAILICVFFALTILTLWLAVFAPLFDWLVIWLWPRVIGQFKKLPVRW